MLDHYFATEDIASIQRGVNTFNHMVGLLSDPLHGRFIAEEQDLVAALNSVRDAYKASERMLGKQKYQGVPFNAAEQVMKDMTSYLLTGRQESEDAYFRKRNLPMFVLVIEPTLALMKKFNHEEALDKIDEVIDELIDLVNESVSYTMFDGGHQARVEVQALIAARELQKKLARESKVRPKKKSLKDLFMEILEEVMEEEGLE